jgi:hypothetical protein
MKLFAKPAIVAAVVLLAGCETGSRDEVMESQDYSFEIPSTIEARMPTYPTISVPQYEKTSELEEKTRQTQIESMRNDPERAPDPTDDQAGVRKLMGDPIKIDRLAGGREEWHYCTQTPGDTGFSARLAVFVDGKLTSVGEDTGAAYAVCELTSRTAPPRDKDE